MSELAEHVHLLRRDVKVLTMRLLSALKDFYTFKELEEILGIPYQTLWRYTNFLTTPEESTARKLVQIIREKKLIENAFDRSFARIKNLSDIWDVVKNIGFLDLVAFEALELLNGEEVDGVLAFPEEAGILGAIIAHWVRGNICVTTRSVSLGDVIVEPFREDSLLLNFISVSRGCIPRKGKVILTTIILYNRELLEAAVAVVKKSGAQPSALISIFAVGNEWERVIEDLGIHKYKIFRYVSLTR